jgi:hypothetical protein
MAKLIEDFLDRLISGKGPYKTKITITDDLTGTVDEFYVFSKEYNFDDVKACIRGLYAGNPEDDEYLPYVVSYIEFVLSDPFPDIDQQKIVYDAQREKYIQSKGMRRYHKTKSWDWARQRFDKAVSRNIDRLLETALIIED